MSIKTFSLEQKSKTDYLDADLIIGQYKLYKIEKFMEIKSINPKLKQFELATELKIPSSTLQRYRREKNWLSPRKIPPASNTTHTRKQKTSNTKLNDVKTSSNDLKMTPKKTISIKRRKSKEGNPNDNHTQGSNLNEKVFSSTQMAEIL